MPYLKSMLMTCLVVFVVVPTLAQGPSLRAGAAKSDISRIEEGLRINDPVYSKALVLDDGTTKAVIIGMDVTAIGGIGEVLDSFLPALRARIESELGIPGLNVLVNASHNHPPLRFLCTPEEQVAKTFDAVKRAFDSMEPVTAGATSLLQCPLQTQNSISMEPTMNYLVRRSLWRSGPRILDSALSVSP